MHKIDKIDHKILDILQADGRITNAKLSKDVGLSPAPTLERVKKLENMGVIKSYHAKLDTSKIQLGVSTYVMVSLKAHNKANIEKFIEAINNVDEIIECNHVTGSHDFILKVISRDIASYQKLMLERVSEIEVVDSMQSMVILSCFKDSKVLPIPAN